MKIIFFRHSLLNRGGDKVTVLYANHLVSLGHEVSIETSKVNTVFRLNPYVKIVKMLHKTKLRTILKMCLYKINADIIIADIIVNALFLDWRNKGRVVYFGQDYDTYYYTNPIMKMLIHMFYYVGLKLRKIKSIVVSDGLKQELQKFTDNIKVVTNGVDHTVFHQKTPSGNHIKQERRILVFSRLDSRKGFTTAVKVIQSLVSTFSKNEIKIMVIGEMVDQNLWPFETVNHGYVSEDELNNLLNDVDLLLYPTRHEGFGLFVLEAMATGCPVVTTNTVQYAVHKENAWVAEIDNAKQLAQGISAVLKDKAFRNKLIKNGLELAKKYNIEHTLNEFENAITR